MLKCAHFDFNAGSILFSFDADELTSEADADEFDEADPDDIRLRFGRGPWITSDCFLFLSFSVYMYFIKINLALYVFIKINLRICDYYHI